ncbi:3-dehydroquinate synthase, partial [Helicosporidium sp. ATCC 50920]
AHASAQTSPYPSSRVETVTVSLGPRSYPIYIGSGLLGQSPPLLQPHILSERALVVTNDVVAPLWLDRCVEHLKSCGLAVDALVLPDGEAHKTVGTAERIWTRALELGLTRDATLVALGGGVVGDVAGWAAASYQRGVSFVQVPTTLLSQVDSSVGGKTGVNHALGKNMIGAFHQPVAVLADTDTLATLPDRQLSSGLAEVLKYALIGEVLDCAWLERALPRLRARDPEALAVALRQSVLAKAEIVALDEREGGVRALLNLGHTFGHAVEAAGGYGDAVLHGEGVAVGMAMAAAMARRMGWVDEAYLQRVRDLVQAAGLPLLPPRGLMTEARFAKYMALDKKVLGGKLRLVLPRGMSSAVVTSDFDRRALEDTIREFCV